MASLTPLASLRPLKSRLSAAPEYSTGVSFGFWIRTRTAKRSSRPSLGNGSMPATSIDRGSRFGSAAQPAIHDASSNSDVAARTRLPLCLAPRERAAADALAELRKVDTDGCGRPRKQARRRQAGQRVDLEAPEAALGIHAEIDSAIDVELQRPMHFEREVLDARRLLGAKIGGKDFLGAAGLVLRGVVEDRAGVGNDLADGERLVVEDSDCELAAVDVALEHDLGVETACEL